MTRLRTGSAEHKARFCRVFVDTHHPYVPEEIRWPALDASALARLRGLPFWGEAVVSERSAAARVHAMASVEPDAMLREAIELQAFEEARHARLLDLFLGHYAIPYPDAAVQIPTDAEWGFVRMGYGECFDAFFAFGLFRVAADTGFFPPALVELFDGVMQEEARHILFFSNWVAHRRVQLPTLEKPWFLVRRLGGAMLQAFGRVQTAIHLRDAPETADNFTLRVPEEIGDLS